VAHSAGPLSQEWAVTSRRTHGLPEDLLDDWGQLRVPVVFPPKSDSTTVVRLPPAEMNVEKATGRVVRN